MIRSLVVAALLGVASLSHAAELTVGAAASLKDALTEVGTAFTRANPSTKVAFNFAASSVIVQQIQSGAAIDVFVAADHASMDKVTKDVIATTRQDVLAGELALIATAGNPAADAIRTLADLKQPSIKQVAVCDDAVPAGHYARVWLGQHDLLKVLAPRIVKPENVRSALALVASGTAVAGFVYVTDALIEKDRVRIVERATVADGVDVRYPAAVLARTKYAEDAGRFVAFLRTDAARGIFEKFGFKPL